MQTKEPTRRLLGRFLAFLVEGIELASFGFDGTVSYQIADAIQWGRKNAQHFVDKPEPKPGSSPIGGTEKARQKIVRDRHMTGQGFEGGLALEEDLKGQKPAKDQKMTVVELVSHRFDTMADGRGYTGQFEHDRVPLGFLVLALAKGSFLFANSNIPYTGKPLQRLFSRLL